METFKSSGLWERPVWKRIQQGMLLFILNFHTLFDYFLISRYITICFSKFSMVSMFQNIKYLKIFIRHIPNRKNKRKSTPRHIVVKMQDIENKEILKAARKRTDHL